MIVLIVLVDRYGINHIKNDPVQPSIDSISNYYQSKIDSLSKKKDSIQIVIKEKIVKIKSEPIKNVIDHSFDNFLTPIDSNYTVKVQDSLVCIDSSTFRNSVVESEQTHAKVWELDLDNQMCHESLSLCQDTSTVRIESQKVEIKELKKDNFKMKVVGYGSATLLTLLLLHSFL